MDRGKTDVAKDTALAVAAFLVAVILLIALIFGVIATARAFGRHQAIADSHNRAERARIDAENEQHVNALRISAQAQKVKIAQQEAEIRRQNAVGIREAQDEISKTLTPLYVQFEMIQALQDIAIHGQNSSVVFIPSGTAGIPLVSGAGGPRVSLP